MRAARMHQAFSRFLFLFSLSLFCLLHYRQAGSVKYLILFYPLGCHQFQAVLFSFTSVPHQLRYQDLHQLWNISFHSYGLVQREADEQFSAQSFTCASWPDIPCMETCSFLQTHLWITGFNSMWHETVVTAESIMLHFLFFSFSTTLPQLPASCVHTDIELWIVSLKETGQTWTFSLTDQTR